MQWRYAISKSGDIEGIKPKHKIKLKKANVHSIDVLLKCAATPRGNVELQANSGIDKKLIEDWANRVDLLRIRASRARRGLTTWR